MGLTIILLSLLPAIIYLLIIYITIPHKKISLSTAFMHLFVGFMSVGVLKWIWMLCPGVTHLAESVIQPHVDPFLFYHWLYFGQVGFFEELSKLIIFLIIGLYRLKITSSKKQHPMATMIYMGAVALGFAVIENILYGINYGEGVLYWRAFTSVIGHLVFGLFMGYWIALGRMRGRLYDRSLLAISLGKKKRLKGILYTIVGLFSATILHGMYNLHIQLASNRGMVGIYMLLILSIVGVYWCFNNLNKLHKEKLEDIKKKKKEKDKFYIDI